MNLRLLLLPFLVLTFLCANSQAADDPEENRDEAIFGDSEKNRDDDIFKEDPSNAPKSSLESTLETALNDRHDLTEIGGQIYSRLSYNLSEETKFLRAPLSSPALVDIYLDSRPNDRLRAYVRGRLSHNFSITEGQSTPWGTEQSPTLVLLDQLWLKFDIAQTLYVTFGKQPLRWGSSRFWNPTDFVNSQIRDPLAFVDERQGIGILKMHYPIESLGWNFYVILNADGAQSLKDVGTAVRAEILLGTTEISLSAADKKGGPEQFGADISTGIGLVDLRLEMAAQKRNSDIFFATSSEAPVGFPIFGYDPPPNLHERDKWLYQAVVGAEFGINYSDEDSVYIGAEYFYNEFGYDDKELFNWLAMTGTLRPLYLGKQYASTYIAFPNPGRLTHTYITLSALANLSFDSYLTRLDYRVKVLTFLDVFAGVSYHFGSTSDLRVAIQIEGMELSETETKLLHQGIENQGTFSQKQIEGLLTQLEGGVSIPPQFMDFQFGLRMVF